MSDKGPVKPPMMLCRNEVPDSPDGAAVDLLLIGASYRSAPLFALEQLGADDADQIKILELLLQSPQIGEAIVLATCNRFEVYAVVEAFQDGLRDIGQVLASHAGTTVGDLARHTYIRRGDEAARHLFRVASGLDSALTGDPQVLGQVRRAYAAAEANTSVGPVLHRLAQRALAAGKRVRAETAVGAADASVVTVGLGLAARTLVHRGGGNGLADRAATVIGTGAMGTLAATHLASAGCRRVCIVSRSSSRGDSLAARIRETGTQTDVFTTDRISEAMAPADIVVSGAAASEPVISVAAVRAALAVANSRDPRRHLVFCDLGMPRNVDPAVACLQGISLIDVERICREPGATNGVEAASQIIDAEFAAYLAEQRATEVAPTVASLRRRAASVIEAELSRLDNRLPGLGCTYRDEMARTVNRVVDKLLHAPTARVKQLSSTSSGVSYAEALRELFELDQLDTKKVPR